MGFLLKRQSTDSLPLLSHLTVDLWLSLLHKKPTLPILCCFASQEECGITNCQSSWYCPQELAKATEKKHLQSPFQLSIRHPALPLKKRKLRLQNGDFVLPPLFPPMELKAPAEVCCMTAKGIFTYQLLLMSILFHRSLLTLEYKPQEASPSSCASHQ